MEQLSYSTMKAMSKLCGEEELPKYYTPMKDVYIMSRTSDRDSPPLPEVVKVLVPYWDNRVVKTPLELNPYTREDWYKRGTEHGINSRGCITRRLEDSPVFILLIPNLFKFQKELDEELILNNSGDYLTLEIYDDYRE